MEIIILYDFTSQLVRKLIFVSNYIVSKSFNYCKIYIIRIIPYPYENDRTG